MNLLSQGNFRHKYNTNMSQAHAAAGFGTSNIQEAHQCLVSMRVADSANYKVQKFVNYRYDLPMALKHYVDTQQFKPPKA